MTAENLLTESTVRILQVRLMINLLKLWLWKEKVVAIMYLWFRSKKEVDRKAAAKSVGEKTVDMIHVKDLTKITGYIRGGCSPLGMKKNYPVVFDQSAENFEEIYVSGGRVGLTLKVPLKDLLDVTQGKLAPITME